jgi:hypothetical protein
MTPAARRPLPALLLLAATWSATPASADVRVEVDPGAPFTENDLADAVMLRSPRGGAGEVVIRVAKLGHDRLIVEVGGRTQLIELADRDRVASTRVVALVITSLLDDDREKPPAPVVDTTAPAPSPAPGLLPRRSLAVGTSLTRDDNGYWIPLVNASLAYAVAPGARVVATGGLGRYDGYLGTSSLIVPLRLGVEGRAGAAAIELGAQLLAFREGSCGTGEWGSARSGYGAAKVFLPLGARSRLVGELGGHYVLSNSVTTCNSASNYTSYGGWLGAGVEWTR